MKNNIKKEKESKSTLKYMDSRFVKKAHPIWKQLLNKLTTC